MISKWTRCPAAASAGLFIAFSGAIAQQGANTSGTMSPQSGSPGAGMSASHGKMSGGMSSGMKASSADMKFVMEAAQGGMEEVELGKVGVQKAQNDQVKQFAQRMIDDHTKANDELKSIASKNGITIPADLDAKHKAMVDKMSAMSGPGFDRAYMMGMVKDHQKDVADFQKESTGGANSDIKGFAAKTLPTLQDHLKMAQETAASVHSGGSMSKK